MELQPPLTANVLAHIPSFQAAVQLISPLDDNAWELLKPRLLAQKAEAERREQQEQELTAHLRSAQERLQDHGKPEATNAETKQLIDKNWDDAQAPLRTQISSFADEIIRDGWDQGHKVNKENSSQFVADVLLYVRKRFYAEIAKNVAAASAAGQKPACDPPEGPFTQKLTLENMKWLFDVKVKLHTDYFQKELFFCNGCEGNNNKAYGFEGVVQHYAAKHTSALSRGSVVVHWRAEWPEIPPFKPDPEVGINTLPQSHPPFSVTPPLTMFIHGLSNNKEMRPRRKPNTTDEKQVMRQPIMRSPATQYSSIDRLFQDDRNSANDAKFRNQNVGSKKHEAPSAQTSKKRKGRKLGTTGTKPEVASEQDAVAEEEQRRQEEEIRAMWAAERAEAARLASSSAQPFTREDEEGISQPGTCSTSRHPDEPSSLPAPGIISSDRSVHSSTDPEAPIVESDEEDLTADLISYLNQQEVISPCFITLGVPTTRDYRQQHAIMLNMINANEILAMRITPVTLKSHEGQAPGFTLTHMSLFVSGMIAVNTISGGRLNTSLHKLMMPMGLLGRFIVKSLSNTRCMSTTCVLCGLYMRLSLGLMFRCENRRT
ncbi:hypothetical protein SLS62_000254 [Diatrype stigma]|uniref:Uncharacterized protein n=1 Tax=Diatrype stigma TaxID=117547 RepID=A0AAN9V266_9PEZI